MRIGLDIDGVVYRWTRASNLTLAEHRGVPALGEHEYWDYVQDQVTVDDWKWLWTKGVPHMFGRYDLTYPGAPTFMRWAGVHHELACITHRPGRAAPHTAEFLAHHRVQFSSVHVIPAAVAKSSIRPEADVYLDDKPAVVLELLENTGAHVFMPARRWNEKTQALEHPRFHVYLELREVRAWIEENA